MKNTCEDPEIGMMTANQGKMHKYLGMMLYCSKRGVVLLDMTEYAKKILNDFDFDLGEAKLSAPAANHLFNMREEGVKKLDEKRKQTLHTYAAKGLFVCKRERPDIQVPIAFLSTRVKDPDEDDWNKLIRMMNYLKGAQNLVLTLDTRNFNIIKWFINTSHAVHDNMRGYTGIAMKIGKGHPVSKSTKQKVNTRSSSKPDLVGTDDGMSEIS